MIVTVNLSAESTIDDIGAVLSALRLNTPHGYPGLKPWAEIEQAFSPLLTNGNYLKERLEF